MNGPVVKLFSTTAQLVATGPAGLPRLTFGGPVDFSFRGAVIQLSDGADFWGYVIDLNGDMIGTGHGQALHFDLAGANGIKAVYLG